MVPVKRYVNGIRKSTFSKGGWHVVLVLLFSVLVLLMIRTFLFTQVEVQVQRPELGLFDGDRVVVNRTSYGIRMPFGSWLGYRRWGKCNPGIGDLVVYDFPDGSGRICMDRVDKLPGDTLWVELEDKAFIIVPQNCLGVGDIVLPEQQIIGRPSCVSYSVDKTQPFYKLLRPNRLFVKIR